MCALPLGVGGEACTNRQKNNDFSFRAVLPTESLPSTVHLRVLPSPSIVFSGHPWAAHFQLRTVIAVSYPAQPRGTVSPRLSSAFLQDLPFVQQETLGHEKAKKWKEWQVALLCGPHCFLPSQGIVLWLPAPTYRNPQKGEQLRPRHSGTKHRE